LRIQFHEQKVESFDCLLLRDAGRSSIYNWKQMKRAGVFNPARSKALGVTDFLVRIMTLSVFSFHLALSINGVVRNFYFHISLWGHAVEALCYNPEGRVFDSR
jgi:hypothetical protein